MTEDLALFHEDASDQLSFMEQALLDANENGLESENLGALFRAMHTIKGTAGMFGFDEIISFTHTAESLLDMLRQEKLQATDAMLELFLECKDQTTLLVEYAVNEVETDDNIKQNSQILQKKLNAFMQNDTPTLDFSLLEDDSNKNDTIKTWKISLGLNEDFFRSGMDILSIFSYIHKVAKNVQITPLTDKIKTFDMYEPLSTSINFEISLETQLLKDDIIEFFEFVEDDIVLELFEVEKPQKIEEEPVIDTTNKELSSEEKPLAKTITKKQTSSTLRVDSIKIDKLINQIGEMVIFNAKIDLIANRLDDVELLETMEDFKILLEDVRDGVMGIRMVQVQDSFNKLRRIVNDTAKKLDKKIKFTINGGETELDKGVVEKIADPLVHMLRNSVDHGIESRDTRVSHGKNEEGIIELRAYADSSFIVIEIEDDGGGINKEIVLSKAIENGLINEQDKLSDKEIFNLIFTAGFSTASEISDISGRGVGMDVVKKNIESLRGILDIESTEGKGSKFTIRLPLTLAVIDGLLINIGKSKYIVPLELITECIEYTQMRQEQTLKNGFIKIREEAVPIINLKEYYQEENIQNIRENIIIAKYANKSVGLVVDEFYGEQQVVIKPLGVLFDRAPGISGGTILGDGEVAMIIDIAKLIQNQNTRSYL